MPIYEYACKKCDGEFEVSQRITDKTLKRYLCPHCGKRTAVTKLISRSSFHLKGSGWYATDYGKNGEKPSKSDDAKNGDTKSDDAKSDDAKSKSKDAGSSSKKESSSKAASPSKSTSPSAS